MRAQLLLKAPGQVVGRLWRCLAGGARRQASLPILAEGAGLARRGQGCGLATARPISPARWPVLGSPAAVVAQAKATEESVKGRQGVGRGGGQTAGEVATVGRGGAGGGN